MVNKKKVKQSERGIWAFTGKSQDVEGNDFAHFSGWYYGATEDDAKRSFLAPDGYAENSATDAPVNIITSSKEIPIAYLPQLLGDCVTHWRGENFLYINEDRNEVEGISSDYSLILVTVFCERPMEQNTSLYCVLYPTKGVGKQTHSLYDFHEAMRHRATVFASSQASMSPESHYEDGWMYRYTSDLVLVPVKLDDIPAIRNQWGNQLIVVEDSVSQSY